MVTTDGAEKSSVMATFTSCLDFETQRWFYIYKTESQSWALILYGAGLSEMSDVMGLNKVVEGQKL